jgi:hypothetical protein
MPEGIIVTQEIKCPYKGTQQATLISYSSWITVNGCAAQGNAPAFQCFYMSL